MAPKGSSKFFSQLQEKRVAKWYRGKPSPSSGAAITDQGDVRTDNYLIECKHTGSFDKPSKSISLKLTDLEKIADEAWSEGRWPMLCLSLYAPDSVLADATGFVDLSVKLMANDYDES